jgi:molybdopterin synthase sulfur carrier subunit
MISIRIPTPLRNLSASKDEVAIEGATLRAALDDLEKRHPGFKERIMNEKGALRPYINIFHNDEDVRFGDGLDTSLKDGDKLAIVPAIAGG